MCYAIDADEDFDLRTAEEFEEHAAIAQHFGTVALKYQTE
jgi:hypothetical protein